jgi:hypothetical protein
VLGLRLFFNVNFMADISGSISRLMRYVAFAATEYEEVLSSYQPGQMVGRWKNQRLENHLFQHLLSDYKPEDEDRDYLRNVSALSHLTLLIARGNLII